MRAVITTPVRLTATVKAAGCAAKLGPADLAAVLARVPRSRHPDLLVGTETSDDAGVYRVAPDLALVQTVDFFTPIVDDPATFGAVAAANALSDVYAMGGRPLTALNVVCFPRDGLPMEVLAAILAGGAAKAAEAGALVVGGHTVADDEIKYGMAVTGVVHPERVLRNVGARPGDRLILTKALGTGIVTTAAKHERAAADVLAAAVASMTTLNAAAAGVLGAMRVHACTDVTGFGLLGHAWEMAGGGAITLRLAADALPVLPGARRLAGAGEITGGCKRNRAWLADKVAVAPGVDDDLVEVAYDPQTSGGLLAAVPAGEADAAVAALRAAGVAAAALVGVVEPAGGRAVVLE